MGYDVYIMKEPYKPIETDDWDVASEHFHSHRVKLDHKHDIRGGTYAVGGTDEAWLHITFNYSEFFCKYLGGDGLKDLNNMPVRETIEKIQAAILNMKGAPDADYWKPTEGNARAALVNLLNLALLSPETTNGYWYIDY